MAARSILLVGLLVLGACTLQPEPGQVVTRVIIPPGGNPIAASYANSACSNIARGVVQVYVQCMRQQGYQIAVSQGASPYPPMPYSSGPFNLYARGQALGNGTPQVNNSGVSLPNNAAEINDVVPAAEARKVMPTPEVQSQEERMLTAAVEQDSNAWFANKYDSGSIKDFHVITGYYGTPEWAGELRATYNFNGGDSGWVDARFSNGHLECLRYWDASQTCRPVHTAEEAAKVKSFRTKFLYEMAKAHAKNAAIYNNYDPFASDPDARRPKNDIEQQKCFSKRNEYRDNYNWLETRQEPNCDRK